MAGNRLVSVDEDYDFPDPVKNRLASEFVNIGSAVLSSGIGRLVPVPIGDPLPATLNDGDLVIRYGAQGAHYFTDFSGATTGAQPTGWSAPWATGGTWLVAADAAATGGKILRYSTA